jgi:hypothetical protein
MQCEHNCTPAHALLETTDDTHAERKCDDVKAIFGTAFTFVANHMKGMEKASSFTIIRQASQASCRGSRFICTESEKIELKTSFEITNASGD